MKKLFDAINKGDSETVKAVIEKNPDIVSCREKGLRKRAEDESPLRVAIKNCHYDIVCLLTEAGAYVNDYTAISHCIPEYRLQTGTYGETVRILKYLLEHHMNINLADENGVNSFFTGINLSHSMMHSISRKNNRHSGGASPLIYNGRRIY